VTVVIVMTVTVATMVTENGKTTVTVATVATMVTGNMLPVVRQRWLLRQWLQW
jgi:hypothetical protein